MMYIPLYYSSLISSSFKISLFLGTKHATRCGFLFVYSSWYSLCILYRFITSSCFGNSRPTSLQHYVFFSLSILSVKTSDQIYLKTFSVSLNHSFIFPSPYSIFLCYILAYFFSCISISHSILLISNNYMLLIQFCLNNSNSDLLLAYFYFYKPSSIVGYNQSEISLTHTL